MIFRHCITFLLVGVVSFGTMWGNGTNPCSMSNATPGTGTCCAIHRSTPDTEACCAIHRSMPVEPVGYMCGCGCGCAIDAQYPRAHTDNTAPGMACGCCSVITLAVDYQLPGHRNFPVVVGKPVALVIYSVYLTSTLDGFYPIIDLLSPPPDRPPQYLLSV